MKKKKMEGKPARIPIACLQGSYFPDIGFRSIDPSSATPSAGKIPPAVQPLHWSREDTELYLAVLMLERSQVKRVAGVGTTPACWSIP